MAECNQEIYERGVGIMVICYKKLRGAEHIEEYVKNIASESGCKVDWHYMGGRGIIRCFEEHYDKVLQTLKDNLPDERFVYFFSEAEDYLWVKLNQLMKAIKKDMFGLGEDDEMTDIQHRIFHKLVMIFDEEKDKWLKRKGYENG